MMIQSRESNDAERVTSVVVIESSGEAEAMREARSCFSMLLMLRVLRDRRDR